MGVVSHAPDERLQVQPIWEAETRCLLAENCCLLSLNFHVFSLKSLELLIIVYPDCYAAKDVRSCRRLLAGRRGGIFDAAPGAAVAA